MVITMKESEYYLIVSIDKNRFFHNTPSSYISKSESHYRFWIWESQTTMENGYDYDYDNGILARVNSGFFMISNDYDQRGYETYLINISDCKDLEEIKKAIPPELFL